jgi:hypothetical protein
LENNYKFIPTNSKIRKGKKINIEWTSKYLSNEGFHKIVLTNNYELNHKKYYRGILFELNPIRLIDKENKLRLTNEKDIDEIAEKFNKIMNDISPYLNDFFQMKVERIDYTIDLKVDEYIKKYIQLFQRADKPRGFKEQYVKGANKHKQQDDSFYLISKSTTINFYDKEQQLRKLGYSDAEIAEAKNKLRFEVQLHKPKLYNIKNKHKFASRELYHYLKLDYSREQIIMYYDKIIGSGDYIKKDQAVRIINKSNLRKDTKNNLIKILTSIANRRSVWKSRQEFLSKVDIENKKELKKQKAIFSRYLRKLRELGINPVTIPEDWKIKNNKLDNLLGKILDEFEKEQNEFK